MLFTTIAISVCSLYVFMIVCFYFGWEKIKTFKRADKNPETVVSVIVAVRNEEANIEYLIKDIVNQDYPADKFELVFVDDSSTDKTAEMIQKYSEKYQHISFYKLPQDSVGKKAAISLALKHAKGSLIVTTDGDCHMNNKWLSTIVGFYELYKPQMIIAPVFFHNEKNIFESMQSLEFSSLVASGAGAAGINRPVICNAANMAFEKNNTTDSGTIFNTKYQSGDDVFLLHSLKKGDRSSIMFLKSSDAVVYTKPQPDIDSFINQRVRWSAKSKGYADTDSLITVLITFLMNITLLTLLIGGFFNYDYFNLFGKILLIKAIVDLLFLQSFLNYFNKQKLLIWFIPLQLIYFVYVSFIGIFGLFAKVSWKERKI